MGSVFKGLLRKVWNGPFFIGTLTRPVSLGDALLKALETLWRTAVLLIALVALAALALALWLQAIQPVFFPSLEKRILATVSYDDGSTPLPPSFGKKPFRCDADYPLKITFTNLSDVTVGTLNFSIEGRAPNRSTNVVQNAGWRSTDSVIPPDYKSESCWSVEVEPGYDAKGLVYKVEVWSAGETDLKLGPSSKTNSVGAGNAVAGTSPPTSMPPSDKTDAEAQLWAGDYTGQFEGEADGDLNVSLRPDGLVAIALSIASSECTGEVSGVGRPKTNRLAIVKSRDESGNQCSITLNRSGDGIEVIESGCSYYHGFHCSFNGSVQK